VICEKTTKETGFVTCVIKIDSTEKWVILVAVDFVVVGSHTFIIRHHVVIWWTVVSDIFT